MSTQKIPSALQEQATEIILEFNDHADHFDCGRVKDMLIRVLLDARGNANGTLISEEDDFVIFKLHRILTLIEKWQAKVPDRNRIEVEMQKRGLTANSVNELFLYMTGRVEKRKDYESKYEDSVQKVWRMLTNH